MEQIILKGDKVGDKPFGLKHAQDILDLNKRNSTATWALNDPKYKLDENGKIIPAGGSK